MLNAIRSDIKAIVTIPPYAPFIDEVVAHPAVSGVRLNTVMPTKGALEDLLKRLQDQVGEKDLWIDLKGRQLRVKTYGVPPFTEIELTHNISVDTPVTAYFNDGKEQATVLEVDGNRLIMQEGPQRVIGPGESINIPHPSLKIEGYLTTTDQQYIEAGNKLGLTRYMLSFVESQDDVSAFNALVPNAQIVAKIESRKGLNYVQTPGQKEARLMAARGDLYIELKKPHHIINAMENIIAKDPNAIAASRIFSSLTYSLEPSCADIGDVNSLMRMGYKTLMLGDEICQRRESVLSALNLLYEMNQQYKSK